MKFLKNIGRKILIAYADAHITAKENKVKRKQKKEEKREQKERRIEGYSSVNCPYCREHHSSLYIRKNEYNAGDLELERRDGNRWIYLSFITCTNCKDMFGIENYLSEMSSHDMRSSFRLKEKNNE